MTLFNRFLKDESGATAIEYALIAAIIGIALVTVLTTLGENIGTAFKGIGDELKDAVEETPAGT